MEKQNEAYINELIIRYPSLKCVRNDIINTYAIMKESYEKDGKLLVAGNGGSAADSEHIVGELMKRFQIPRIIPVEMKEKLRAIDCERGEQLAQNLEQSLMAIPLVSHEALSTAYLNDVDGDGIFAQQLYGYARTGDVFLGISTSGNSENIIQAAVVAKALGVKVIALTGNSGGELAKMADQAIIVPEKETYKIQELHLPIYHCLCHMLEEHFFGER